MGDTLIMKFLYEWSAMKNVNTWRLDFDNRVNFVMKNVMLEYSLEMTSVIFHKREYSSEIRWVPFILKINITQSLIYNKISSIFINLFSYIQEYFIPRIIAYGFYFISIVHLYISQIVVLQFLILKIY